MDCARVANKDCLLLYYMAALTICLARVYRMAVIEAATDGVSFNNLVAHLAKILFASLVVCQLVCPG
ncbi:hypothetical protein EMPG_16655 [Blastomyces silverae]|uniref:Uncharacterized protein n=1 Tax=Blastomyces silverae TaxID=2060906 RepID=A0A0H1B9X5_9EURO|nr:hypothetical protein EMPG_16655 [Blastomyces silverae]